MRSNTVAKNLQSLLLRLDTTLTAPGPGKAQTLHYSTSRDPSVLLTAVVAGDGTTKMWTDDGVITGTVPDATERRFYRVQVRNGP